MNLNAAEFTDLTEEEVAGHFSMFKEFDLDDSGFISPDNLMSIMEASGCHSMGPTDLPVG